MPGYLVCAPLYWPLEPEFCWKVRNGCGRPEKPICSSGKSCFTAAACKQALEVIMVTSSVKPAGFICSRSMSMMSAPYPVDGLPQIFRVRPSG